MVTVILPCRRGTFRGWSAPQSPLNPSRSVDRGLDINPEWVTFNFYTHSNPANPAHIDAAKLYPQMQRTATRYLGPTPESRDFFTISTS